MLVVFFSNFLYISGQLWSQMAFFFFNVFYITPLLWNLYLTVNLY